MIQVKGFVGRGSDRGGALRSLSAIGSGLIMAAFVVIGGLLAVFFAATVAVLAVVSSALLAVAAFTFRARARRTVKARNDGVIDARNVGGHNWVATGWNERR
jgi:hypothetical protein